MVLASLQTPERTHKLIDFYNRFQGNALVIDKWFAIQASSLHPDVLEQVKALAEHPDFTLKNPNRVRSLYMPFTGTAQGFEACYRIYEGTALKYEKDANCKGGRSAFGDGLLRASSLASYKEKAWAMRDTFDGVLNVSQRWAQQNAPTPHP